MDFRLTNSPAFGATMTRQTRVVKGQSVEYTKQEWLDSYDSQIRRIEEQKKQSIELDTFMHSKEVKELVESLPESGVLEVAGNFCQRVDSEKTVEPDNFLLIYEQEDLPIEKDFIRNGVANAMQVEVENGKIDKKGIIDWLKMLVEYTK